MNPLFDVFICHASEDKKSLVRPLATRLRKEHLEVWYDEFSLELGDGLRASIDRGLASSRFGIVVLSKAFFRKNWPQRELDGLVAREMIGGRKVILPVWHGLTREDVCRFSPPLADVVSASSHRGVGEIAKEILRVVRPAGSPLIIARDRLIQFGFHPPVVTDQWWLDVVEASNREPAWGFIPQRPSWGRWTFPLPEEAPDARKRGERLAWTALQLEWEDAAERGRVTQITEPPAVLEFIRSHPGLAEACRTYPVFLSNYAPQLTIPGFGGEFESLFDGLLASSQSLHADRGSLSGSGLTTTGKAPRCDEYIALHHPSFGDYTAAMIAGQYVQGEIHGPTVQFYPHFDYIAWLLSEASSWLPERIRDFLMLGMNDWAVWLWHEFPTLDERSLDIGTHSSCGALSHALLGGTRKSPFRWTEATRDDLVGRLESSCRLPSLPETSEALAARFIAHRFAEGVLRDRQRVKRRAGR